MGCKNGEDIMTSKKEEGKGQFVPYDLDFIPPGYEAVYTGERSKERIEPTALNATIRFTDETGYVLSLIHI